jgi:fucose permease
MLSRIVTASLLRTFSKSKVVLVSALLPVAGSVILLSARCLSVLVIGVVLIGASYAPIFPTALAIAGDRYSQTGTVFGLLFAVALVGGMTFPCAVGQVSQELGVRTGMIVPLVGAFSISLLAAVLTVQERPARDPHIRRAAM